MMRLRKNLVVQLTPELAAWLDWKEREGYKKTTFMRHVIGEYMAAEKAGQASLLKTAKGVWSAAVQAKHRADAPKCLNI